MTEQDRQDLLDQFQTRLGYTFHDPALLDQALTHSSWAHENEARHNERLEFLGDAVLDAVVVSTLFRRFPGADEGRLSQQKHRLICTETLAEVGRELGLSALLRVGAGAERSGVHHNERKLEDTTEALAGALFLDGGFEVATRVVAPWFEPHLDLLGLERPRGDEAYKSSISVLHERVAKKPLRARAYAIDLGHKGQAHTPVWQVGWWVGGTLLASTWGTSKKAAQRQAAALALEELERLLATGWLPDRDAAPPESVPDPE